MKALTILILIITTLISNFVERTLQHGMITVILRATPKCEGKEVGEKVTVEKYHMGGLTGNEKIPCNQEHIFRGNLDEDDVEENQIMLRFRYKSGKFFSRTAKKDCKNSSRSGNTYTCFFEGIDPNKH